jgi:hypothetical protein
MWERSPFIFKRAFTLVELIVVGGSYQLVVTALS